MSISDPHHASTDSSSSKTRAALSSIKDKTTKYINTIATSNAHNSYGRGISKLISGGSISATDDPSGSNVVTSLPSLHSEQEVLMSYPSYCRHTETGHYEVDVRGWLYIQGSPNRKTKLVLATARRLAGIKSASSKLRLSQSVSTLDEMNEMKQVSLELNEKYTDDETEEEMKKLEGEIFDVFGPSNNENTPPVTTSPNSTPPSIESSSYEETLKSRLEPFLVRPVASRKIKITFGGLTDSSGRNMKVFEAVTNSSGRFSTRIKLNHKPSVVSVEANEFLVSFEEIVNVEPYGISVISDIDDTIKNSGILGDKRELFRNVFMYDYEKIAIEGVQEWYHELQKMGAKFHYVSNSPWQLYPTISTYLKSAKFPPGSMHLKEYSGFLNGILEPASDRKKSNMHSILRDFPNRKFVLIGDSGEGDLEAYIDVARHFPDQILAIYIRDVTLPPDGDINAEFSNFRRNLIPRPDEIDLYDRSLPIKLSKLSSLDTSRRSSTSIVQSKELQPRNLAPPKLPARPASTFPALGTSPSATSASRRTSPLISLSKEPEPPKLPIRPISSVSTLPASLLLSPDNSSSSCAPPKPPKVVTNNETLDDSYWQNRPEDIPPQLPPRPLPKSDKITSKDFSRAPSPCSSKFSSRSSSYQGVSSPSSVRLYPRSSRTEYSLRAPSDEFEFADILDKKVENWKYRVMRARCELPSDIHFRIWRVGTDIKDEGIEYVKRAFTKLNLQHNPLSDPTNA